MKRAAILTGLVIATVAALIALLIRHRLPEISSESSRARRQAGADQNGTPASHSKSNPSVPGNSDSSSNRTPANTTSLHLEFEKDENYVGSLVLTDAKARLEKHQWFEALYKDGSKVRVRGLTPGPKTLVILIRGVLPIRLELELKPGDNYLSVSKQTVHGHDLKPVHGVVLDVDDQPVYEATVTTRLYTAAVPGGPEVLCEWFISTGLDWGCTSRGRILSNGTYTDTKTTPPDGRFELGVDRAGQHSIEIEYGDWKGSAMIDTAIAENKIKIPVKATPFKPRRDPDWVVLYHDSSLFTLARNATLNLDEKSKKRLLDILGQMKDLDFTSPEVRGRLEALESKFNTYLTLRSGMNQDVFEDAYGSELAEEVGIPLDDLWVELHSAWLDQRTK